MSLPLLVVVDHARAGNNFFKRLFDQHSEIMSLTVVGYLYTRVINFFGERETVGGREACDWAFQDSNIKRIAAPLTTEIKSDLLHIGENLDSELDRGKVQDVLLKTIHTKETVTRKDVIVSIFLAFALGTNRNVSGFKYLMLDEVAHNDLPDGEEQNQKFFSSLKNDFSQYRIIHLVRDPRANFASIKHQYVSTFGNMYPIRATKIWRSVGCNSIWLWIMKYTNEGAKSLAKFRKRMDKDSFLQIRVEDVNLHFVETMTAITQWLNVGWFQPWQSPEYFVTSCGVPWRGISAYAPHYNPVQDGPMQNDSDEDWRICRPNPQLNQKWKKRLLPREIKIIEAVNYEELIDLGYPLLYPKALGQKWRVILLGMLPFSGEIPLRLEWWFSKKRIDKRIAFFIVLPFSYLISRVMFFQMFFRGKLRAR